MGVRATMYGSKEVQEVEVRKNCYPCLKCHENEEKIDNYHVLINDNRIKTTQPISMILVSFFSEDNVLSDEIKICFIFEYQSNENRAFPFFGGTPGIGQNIIHIIIHVITAYHHGEIIDEQQATNNLSLAREEKKDCLENTLLGDNFLMKIIA